AAVSPVAAAVVPAPVARGASAAAVVEVAVVGGLDVGDVQEAVAADTEVDERGLDARLDVDDAALIDIPDEALVAGTLDVEFFQDAVLENGDANFLRLKDIDEHLF